MILVVGCNWRNIIICAVVLEQLHIDHKVFFMIHCRTNTNNNGMILFCTTYRSFFYRKSKNILRASILS